MQEIWKEVKGYEGIYEVSNLGNVRSLDREVWNGRIFHHKPGKVLKPIMLGKYHGVQLMTDGKGKKFYIHRLVALAFIGEPSENKTVNHKDGNKFNNVVTNLEWCSQSKNNQHALDNGLRKPVVKFSDETVLKMKTDFQTGLYKQSEIADKYGVSKMQTHRILKNKLRKDVI